MGGIEFHVQNLSKELAENGNDVHIFTSVDNAKRMNVGNPRTEKKEEYTVHYLRSRLGIINPNLENFDLIHVHEYFRALADYILFRWSDVKPVVITLHGGVLAPHYDKSPYRFGKLLHDKFLLKPTISKAKRIITVTNIEKELLTQRYKIPSSKVTVIPNGIEDEAFTNPSRNSSFIRNPYLLTISRMAKIKHINHVIEVLTLLPKDLHYVVAGPDEGELSNLKQLCQRLDISERVHFIGSVFGREKYDLIGNAVAFVLPSSFEAQGIVLIEAMAQGTPIIATNVGGISESIIHGHTGFLYNFGDLPALKDLAERCYHDDSIRKRMNDESPQRAKSTYGWKIIARKILDVYSDAARNVGVVKNGNSK